MTVRTALTLSAVVLVAFGSVSAVASKGGPPPVKQGDYTLRIIDQLGSGCTCANRGTVTATDASGIVVSRQTFSSKPGEDARAASRAAVDVAKDLQARP